MFFHIVTGFTVVCDVETSETYKTSFGDGTIFIPYDVEYLKKTVGASISPLPPQVKCTE